MDLPYGVQNETHVCGQTRKAGNEDMSPFLICDGLRRNVQKVKYVPMRGLEGQCLAPEAQA